MIRSFTTKVKYSEIIKVTNRAWDKITEIVRKKNAIGFIFSATSGGVQWF